MIHRPIQYRAYPQVAQQCPRLHTRCVMDRVQLVWQLWFLLVHSNLEILERRSRLRHFTNEQCLPLLNLGVTCLPLFSICGIDHT